MEFTLGSGGDEHEASNSNKRRSDKKAYQRHSISQIHQLEEFFKTCPHPDEAQRNQLSKDLGLEVRQVKFWFQNKRTQTKVHYEKSDNSTLRAENERMLCENLAIREALHNIICPSCGTHPPNEEERQLQLLKLQEENAMLKNEHERVSRFLAKFVGRPTHEPSRLSAASSFCNAPPHAMDLSDGLALDFPHFAGVPDVEKPLIAEAAATAIKELIKLLRINEPFWAMTSTSPEGRYVIDRETYKKVFPRSSYLSTATARLESSKDFGVVAMNAAQLVAMMMNEDAMLDLFPSILTKAKTYQVLEEGDTENQSGRLMLMYEQMHILSPLVSPRNFYVLRHCQMVEAGTWVILDLSYNWLKDNLPVTHSWRRPSGCMIEGMPDGQSKITWVEHVEVEDKPGTHPLYRDLIGGGSAYGAERWIVTLQRMCERLKFPYKEIEPNSSKSILKLSQRMLNSFCSNMSMSGKIDFSKLSEVNSSGVRISVRKAVEPGQPSGMIVTAATSLWVPLHHEVLFNFFRDLRNRAEWDILTSGYQLEEVTHITTGAHPGNFTSVIRFVDQPHVPIEQYMLVLQECWADQLGGMLVYSPVDVRAMNIAATTGDTSEIPILPTGFIISGDGRRETKGSGASTSASSSRAGGASAGSLLTVVFQILVAETSNELSMEYVSTVNWLISLSVQRIKAALNCSNLE